MINDYFDSWCIAAFMSSYNNILFPFDSAIPSKEAFSYAIDLADQNDSVLILLYAYRLGSDNQQKLISASELREESKKSADKQLSYLRDYFDIDKVKYEFHPEIGFLPSRILLKLRESPIDLLLLEQSVLSQLNGQSDQISCPILIIPH